MEEIKLTHIAEVIADKLSYCNKELLTVDDACKYLGITKSTIYRMTMQRVIPHFKPTAKLLYFKKGDLDKWVQSNRIASDYELTQQANEILKGGVYNG